ncbi:laccase-7-like isoform X2 [Papaver somniferum]|uniref:laccase-7-like isoform X2 n=1 Tax=Papaver somniferum TaxID=3469 RepID=UPI000E6FC9EB|nr:laccase-7-like isoform X2 [Papaver somniferum]
MSLVKAINLEDQRDSLWSSNCELDSPPLHLNNKLIIGITMAVMVSASYSNVVEHTFHVGNLSVRRVCREQTIIAVNGSLPGPTLQVAEGDTLVIHVVNKSPYNVSIHWHGVFQLLTAWADGPGYATQCPIQPGNKYTYKFKVAKQEGTLWWHAHTSFMRATVYGALIIRPRAGRSYPFPTPYKEVPIMLGEWWNANVMDVERIGMAIGGVPNVSDAYSINGRLGDLSPCSKKHTYKLNVVKGKTYLLRLINAALNNQFFFKTADHKFTVVAIDASYTEPYHTDVVVLGPGQTTDVLLQTDQPIGDYYMAARPYVSAMLPAPFSPIATTGILRYRGGTTSISSASTPKMPILPAFNDTPSAHRFHTNLTGLKNGPFFVKVPRNVDVKMLITVGVGISTCQTPNACIANPFGPNILFSASMNNQSFQLPSSLSLLEAFVTGAKGVYTEDFPDQPPLKFNYATDNNQSLWMTLKNTKVKRLKFNSKVEIVFQNTNILSIESHVMHIHGFNFHVLAQGFGTYNQKSDKKNFNYVNPQERNTVAVPTGGWAVIRFRANNPGVWLMHCHMDLHMPMGPATAFLVEDGPYPWMKLPPPPKDLPRC